MSEAAPDVVSLITGYGPYGFGLVAILLLWFFVVRPELKASREARNVIAPIETQALVVLTESLKRTTEAQEQIARTQQATAALMDRALDRIDRIADKMESKV